MRQLLFIALGGALGAVSRFSVSRWIGALAGGTFPFGTLAVNTAGSFLLGFLFSLFNDAVIPSHYKAMITVGFLGAFTTFSTYSLESVNLLFEGEFRTAAINILLNNILALTAAFGGIYLFRVLQGHTG